MKFNLEKIIGKRIHCNTKEKANALLKFLHENGFTWNGGEALTYENMWGYYRQSTYYVTYANKTVCYGDIRYRQYTIVEFEDVLEEEGGNKMYHNLVFINHYAGKNYLFKLPLNVKLNAGLEVFVDTIQGRTMGRCVSDSFIVDDYTKQQIVAGEGAYEPLKEVVGLAKKQEGYRCIEFDLMSVPF